MRNYWYVVREYSGHASKNVLWKVLSRRIKSKEDAEAWLDFKQSEEPKCKKEFFLISKEE